MEDPMRGSDERSGSLSSYVDLEARVRADRPFRVIRALANAALVDLSGVSVISIRISPALDRTKKLLQAMLVQAFYGIRSERHERLFVHRKCL